MNTNLINDAYMRFDTLLKTVSLCTDKQAIMLANVSVHNREGLRFTEKKTGTWSSEKGAYAGLAGR